jgi:hypothetical protein
VKTRALPLKALLKDNFAPGAIEARIATLRLCLDDEVATREPHDEVSENTLTSRRVFYALQKMIEDDVGRERSFQMTLEVLPQSTLLEALPPTLIMEIVGRAELDLVSAIQSEYDVETCMNLKFKNSLSVRQWNRSRLLLGCFLDEDGKWARKKVGVTKVLMPILPEHRVLVDMQRDIEDEHGMRLDGAGDGSSCSILLSKSLEEDVKYNLYTGELVCSDGGKIVTKKNEIPQLQFKMDACRAMSKIQQTSIGYTLPNASAAPNSPYSTTEVCLFEGDDHWDSVQLNAKLTLAEMNTVISNPNLTLSDGRSTTFDVYAGADLSNMCDMLCVSSCNGPFPCPLCKCKREELNPFKKPNTRSGKRTLEEITLLGHTACGFCPGCKMEIALWQRRRTLKIPQNRWSKQCLVMTSRRKRTGRST